jgi:Tol biopolymer transport system component
MPLSAGTRLGPYEILAPLGAGGMGEVYRGKDTKLDREVAIKVLPAGLARDPERLERFEREARMLAVLNHPNIAAIYGLEHSDGVPFLVLELVPGPTLAEMLAGGALEVPEALRISKQIAEALECAHEKGIVHRDLKPANVKVTPEGKVKVLDFGLAKAFRGDGATAENGPTVSLGNTREGTVLGTAAYMSPEQARGKPLDKRTDIWSFGCVLYEALAGRKAFAGETLSDCIANVLQHEPDWDLVPAATPSEIKLLLRRCLQKDRDQRWHDIADVRIEMDEAPRPGVKGGAPAAAAPRNGRRWILAAAGGVVVGAVLSWLAFHLTGLNQASVPQLVSVARLTHDPDYSDSPTWSPDGSQMAFASNRSGDFDIYVRRVGGGQEVNVTNDPGQDFQPAFSPDGNWIAFVSTRSSRTGMMKIGSVIGTEFRLRGGDVWVVPALGGQARLLGKDGNVPIWAPSGGRVAYVSGPENHRSILEVAAEGGTPRALLPSESSSWEIVRAQYSPGERWITFENPNLATFIFPAGGGSPRQLLNGAVHVWDPSGKRLYYCTREPLGGTRLQWVEIDETKGELRGRPQTLALMTGVLRDLAISRDGRQLAVSELEGSINLTRLPLTAEGGSAAGPEEVLSKGQVFDRAPAVSPDGRSIAYNSNRLGVAELWMLRLDTKRLERLQLPGRDTGVSQPNWFPDSRRLALLRLFPDGKQSLWIVAADGSQAEELEPAQSLLQSGDTPVSPDGHSIVYAAKGGQHYQLFRFDISARQARQLTFSAGDKLTACWSPDGRWLVYASQASGSLQLWRMPAAGGQAQLLTEGSDRIRHTFHSSDGRWLYFQPNHLNIYRMPAAGGKVEQVTRFPESGLFLEEPTISPDRRYLVYCRSNGGSSLWLLKIGTAGSGSN